MAIIDELTLLPDRELAMKCQQMTADCESVQRGVLAEILQAVKDTEIGREKGFAGMESAEDYRAQMPLTTWDDYEAYSERQKRGEENITFVGRAQGFTISSGTTSARAKYIPVSPMQAKALSLVERMRMVRYFMAEPRIAEGKVMPLVNTPESETTEAGIPVGNASGMAMMRAGMAEKIAFPMSVFMIKDDEERDYQMMLSAIGHRDVSVVAGNNAGRLTSLIRMAQRRRDDLTDDIAKRDPERAAELRQMTDFTPREYWKELRMGLFWTSASVGKYVEELRPLLPADTKMMDVGYGASEGKFNIPLMPGQSSGVLSVATAFYEFIPEGGGEPLMAHEVEAGKNYELVITTWGGLYRYNMQDIVRVTGFAGTTPMIEFQYKSIEVLNMVDEKLPASVVCNLIREYYARRGTVIRQIQIYQNAGERRYDIYIEPVEPGMEQGEATDQAIDDLLAANFQAYELFKNNMHLLNRLHIMEVRQGWQESLYRQAVRKPGMTNSQVKLSLIASSSHEEFTVHKP